MIKKTFLFAISSLLMAGNAFAFCGFYVAKADTKLFNKSSQVIIARDEGKTCITMSSDFQGDVKDFAMVVPVPVVIKKTQIKVVNQSIFDKLDAYSGPRLVEYYDQNPCYKYYEREMSMSAAPTMSMNKSVDMMEDKKEYGIKIEESYTVGEYDILVLSATESNGLKRWLIDNDYKIPQSAEEVLEPYIKSNMKFFVAKVNLDNFDKEGFERLRPLQMEFNTDKFMLPIRLGMANAEGSQDLIIYTLTKNGRVETTNYATRKIPSNFEIPLFVKDKFGEFYKSLFDNTWEDKTDAVYLEYSWDLSSSNFVKCDPCATYPPSFGDLQEAGVWWLNNSYYGSSDYSGDVYFTRMHVRYDRKDFPQDLTFQQTPSKESFQGRYILNIPVKERVDCEQAYNYYKSVYDRRKRELLNLAEYTSLSMQGNGNYLSKYKRLMEQTEQFNDDRGELKFVKPSELIRAQISLVDMKDMSSLMFILIALCAILFYYKLKR